MGREREIARVRMLLEHARGGTSGALVIRGEAGIGKTTLLACAADLAAGTRVLRAAGIESESELPFAALAQLMRPIEQFIDVLGDQLAAVMRAALAIGPAVTAVPLQIGVAVLNLLAVAADEQPLTVIVDDLHCVDHASATALLFAARRLGAEGIAMLFAVRENEPGAPDTTGLEHFAVGGLDAPSAQTLLAATRDGDVSDAVIGPLNAAVGGNPLALIEGTRQLTADERSGRTPLPLLPRTGARLERAFSRRIERMSPDARRALVLAAVADGLDAGEVAAGLAELGLSPSVTEEAETAGIVSVRDGRFEFSHPLVRSAAYHSAMPAARRSAHAALARALAATAPSRSVLHAAEAAVEADAQLAAALDRLAHGMAGRSAPLEAARMLERAARLSPDPGARVGRLLAAARQAAAAGEPRQADALVEEGLAETSDPPTRAAFQLQRGLVRMTVASPRGADDELVRGAGVIEREQPLTAAFMLVTAAFACLMQGQCREALEIAERTSEIAARVGGLAEITADAALATARVVTGAEAAAVEPLHGVAWALGTGGDIPADALPAMPLFAFRWADRFEDATRLLRARIAAARALAAPASLPYDLAAIAEVELGAGAISAAYANAAEGVQLARDTKQLSVLPFCLVALAWVEAVQGREPDCREHVVEALALADRLGVGAIPLYAGSALGLLELGLGHPEEAVRALRPPSEIAKANGAESPNLCPWQANLIEAYVRSGREADAQRELESFARRATRSRTSSSAAAVLRCRALLAAPEEFDAIFEQALRLFDTLPLPLERARTELCWGERMRRLARRGEAREPLRHALDTFERLGAHPWVALTRAELLAAGDRQVRPAASTDSELTAQELQVARAVAGGATNADAASQLFISPKTVEKHLTSAYRKLGLRSRAELAARFTETWSAARSLAAPVGEVGKPPISLA